MRQPGIFGQLCWDTYTLVVLGFRISSTQKASTITDALDEAAVKLLAAYPFLAGQVINEGRSLTNSGTYKIVPYAPHSDARSPVRQKDCTKLCASYDEIIRASAPYSMLDGEVLCPARGFGYAYHQKAETPVFFIQANFIHGGLLLCFERHAHPTIRHADARGRARPKACGDWQPGRRQHRATSQRRREVIRPCRNARALGPGPWWWGPPPLPEGLNPRWVYWRFPSDKLADLKKMAASSAAGARVSTNDAITAFYAQRLTVMRIAAGRLSRDEKIHCLRAADARARLTPPVPEGYLGHLVVLSFTEWPEASTVADSPLSQVVRDIRASLEQVDDHFIRSLATLVRNTDDKTTLFYGAKKQLGKDIFISSWAQMDLARTCDFGSLFGGDGAGADGRPDFVRRPKMDILPDLTYIMPRNRDGDMDLGACLFEQDIQGLEGDEAWSKYTKMIG